MVKLLEAFKVRKQATQIQEKTHKKRKFFMKIFQVKTIIKGGESADTFNNVKAKIQENKGGIPAFQERFVLARRGK